MLGQSFENRSQIDPESCPELPRSIQNRLKIDPATLSGRPVVPKSIRKASWERLGSVSGRPRHAPGSPGGSPRMARDARRSAREHPGMLRSRQNRRQVAPGSPKLDFFPHAHSRIVAAEIFLRFLSIFGLFVKSAKSPKYRACQQNQGFAHSRHESCRSRNVASKNNENRSQNRPEIVENRVSGPPGRPCRSTFAARSVSFEQSGQCGAIRGGFDGPGAR